MNTNTKPTPASAPNSNYPSVTTAELAATTLEVYLEMGYDLSRLRLGSVEYVDGHGRYGRFIRDTPRDFDRAVFARLGLTDPSFYLLLDNDAAEHLSRLKQLLEP